MWLRLNGGAARGSTIGVSSTVTAVKTSSASPARTRSTGSSANSVNTEPTNRG